MKALKNIVLFLSFLSFTGILTACEGKKGITTAKDVKDEDSLKDFVLSARDHLEDNYEQAVVDFRKPGQWNHGAIYLFILRDDGTTLFHAKTPDFEGQKVNVIDRETGRDITDKLLEKGFRSKGGFVTYNFDNPATPHKDSSQKISYVVHFVREGEPDYIVGSGFYLD